MFLRDNVMHNLAASSAQTLTLKLSSDDLCIEKLSQLEDILYANPCIQKLGFNLSQIKVLGNEFFEWLGQIAKYKDISVYSLDAENMVLFYLMDYSKFVSLFLNEKDFLRNKHILVKRRLRICR